MIRYTLFNKFEDEFLKGGGGGGGGECNTPNIFLKMIFFHGI